MWNVWNVHFYKKNKKNPSHFTLVINNIDLKHNFASTTYDKSHPFQIQAPPILSTDMDTGNSAGWTDTDNGVLLAHA